MARVPKVIAILASLVTATIDLIVFNIRLGVRTDCLVREDLPHK